MAKKDLKELAITELEKQAKSLKTIALIFAILLVILTCFSVFVSLRNSEFQPVSIMPIVLFPFLLILAGSIKKINSEIRSRNNP
jgi:uncharacterized membrane protein